MTLDTACRSWYYLDVDDVCVVEPLTQPDRRDVSLHIVEHIVEHTVEFFHPHTGLLIPPDWSAWAHMHLCKLCRGTCVVNGVKCGSCNACGFCHQREQLPTPMRLPKKRTKKMVPTAPEKVA